MSEWDWEQMESEAGGNFLPYADNGTHKVKVDDLDIRETKNRAGETTYWLDLTFKGEDFSYPKVSHAISFKNDSWRRVHYMRILKELGIPEDKAKQAIQSAESKTGPANIVAAYHTVFGRAVQKHPEIEIEVYDDTNINQKTGKPYKRADFKNPAVAFGRNNTSSSTPSNALDGAEEVSLDELPF